MNRPRKTRMRKESKRRKNFVITNKIPQWLKDIKGFHREPRMNIYG